MQGCGQSGTETRLAVGGLHIQTPVQDRIVVFQACTGQLLLRYVGVLPPHTVRSRCRGVGVIGSVAEAAHVEQRKSDTVLVFVFPVFQQFLAIHGIAVLVGGRTVFVREANVHARATPYGVAPQRGIRPCTLFRVARRAGVMVADVSVQQAQHRLSVGGCDFRAQIVGIQAGRINSLQVLDCQAAFQVMFVLTPNFAGIRQAGFAERIGVDAQQTAIAEQTRQCQIIGTEITGKKRRDIDRFKTDPHPVGEGNAVLRAEFEHERGQPRLKAQVKNLRLAAAGFHVIFGPQAERIFEILDCEFGQRIRRIKAVIIVGQAGLAGQQIQVESVTRIGNGRRVEENAIDTGVITMGKPQPLLRLEDGECAKGQQEKRKYFFEHTVGQGWLGARECFDVWGG